MNSNLATPYDQNPIRIAMVARNIRKREGIAAPKLVSVLVSLQLAAFIIWTAVI